MAGVGLRCRHFKVHMKLHTKINGNDKRNTTANKFTSSTRTKQ
jgi:hypothetical protein